MGFLSHRRSNVEVRPEAKWDYIVSSAGMARGSDGEMTDMWHDSN